MTCENRMYARLAVPCVMSVVLGGVATWIAATIADLPFQLGAPTSPLADAPLVVSGITAVVTVGLLAWQAWRVRQWQQGKAPECVACGCLLGEEKQRRWNVCRQCLGCGRFVQTRRRERARFPGPQ